MFGALTYKEECRREDVRSFHMLSFNPAYHQWSKQRAVCVFFSSTKDEDRSHKALKFVQNVSEKRDPKSFPPTNFLLSCLAAVGIFEASPAPWHVPTFGPTRPAIKRWRNQVVGSVGWSKMLDQLEIRWAYDVLNGRCRPVVALCCGAHFLVCSAEVVLGSMERWLVFQAGDEKESQHVPSYSFTSEKKYIMCIYLYMVKTQSQKIPSSPRVPSICGVSLASIDTFT